MFETDITSLTVAMKATPTLVNKHYSLYVTAYAVPPNSLQHYLPYCKEYLASKNNEGMLFTIKKSEFCS